MADSKLNLCVISTDTRLHFAMYMYGIRLIFIKYIDSVKLSLTLSVVLADVREEDDKIWKMPHVLKDLLSGRGFFCIWLLCRLCLCSGVVAVVNFMCCLLPPHTRTIKLKVKKLLFSQLETNRKQGIT